MPESPSDDIKADFIKELKGYIPALRDRADKLHALGPEDSGKDLLELHRLVHTIRGASSLIKLNNLSQVASEFEEVIEEIINKHLSLNPVVLTAISNTIDYLDAYSNEIPGKDTLDQNQRTEVLGTLLEVRKLATSGDGHDLLSQLLSTIDQEEDDNAISDDAQSLTRGGCDPIRDEQNASEKTASRQDNAGSSDALDGNGNESEAIDPLQQELLQDFYMEAEDHFEDLTKALNKFEDRVKAPTKITPEHKELLRLIRRSVHTIKGAAAVIKLKAIAAWGHEVEDVLDWLYEKADTVAPEQTQIIADGVDMLECYVTSPQHVEPAQVEQLRTAFKRIVGSEIKHSESAEIEPAHEYAMPSADLIAKEIADESLLRQADHVAEQLNGNAPLPDADPTKTLRVDLPRVESVVNLAAESSIALTAFERDMEGLDNLIGELDRARLQLSRSARDLELGYEGKAIQQLGSRHPQYKLPAAIPGETTTTFEDFDVLELDRYSELNLIIRSLTETAVDVSTINRQLSDIHSGFYAYLNRLRVIFSELHQKTMRMRMAPMSTIINRMRRTVRETALQLDKQVQLTIHGEHIELDKLVWEKLADPLMHLLRNAIDHGIESAAARAAAAKPETATIDLSAAYQGNQVLIRVSDDGAGIDYDAIRKAVALDQPELDMDGVSDDDLAEMVFQSGFSTRKIISEVSGRGIGLDVVKENILGLKGGVRVEKSAKTSGTTFCIRLPLTMAAMQTLFFDVGGRRYATALHDIKEVMRVNPENIEGRTEKIIDINGRRLPFFQLSDFLAGDTSGSQADTMEQWPLILIIGSGSWQGAVAIDRMFGQKEVIIKSLGTHLHKVKGVAGATTMGDGEVVPILNLEELLKWESARHHRSERIKPKKIPNALEIMVVDDSVTIRNVVSRLMKQQGWKVVTAKDGKEAIECLHTRLPNLIVLDIEMPRMNGFEFLSAIRAQKNLRQMPVVMHTSRASKKHREKASALGCNAFVTKPYDEKNFVALVKQLSR